MWQDVWVRQEGGEVQVRRQRVGAEHKKSQAGLSPSIREGNDRFVQREY